MLVPCIQLFDAIPLPGIIPQRIENISQEVFIYPCSDIAHSSQKVETTQMSVEGWWINKMQCI